MSTIIEQEGRFDSRYFYRLTRNAVFLTWITHPVGRGLLYNSFCTSKIGLTAQSPLQLSEANSRDNDRFLKAFRIKEEQKHVSRSVHNRPQVYLKEFIRLVAEKACLTEEESEKLFGMFLLTLTESLLDKKSVFFPEFSVFERTPPMSGSAEPKDNGRARHPGGYCSDLPRIQSPEENGESSNATRVSGKLCQD